MSSDIEAVKKNYISIRQLDYHRRQFLQPYRSTIELAKFVKENLKDDYSALNIIDVASGAGANIYHLSKTLPNAKWTALDYADNFFAIGKEFIKNIDCAFVKGDLFELEKTFGPKIFDISFSIQTLSWLPTYEKALEEMLKVTKQWVFVTSLFTDFRVDATIKIQQYSNDESSNDTESSFFYNVYWLDKFKDFCLKHGAKEIISKDFVIDVDLEPPMSKLMGTYTVKLADQSRLQLSGPLLMPWKFIAIKL
jgi:ubiquinone/menaquinone biosynthesis C-methylase UbiE